MSRFLWACVFNFLAGAVLRKRLGTLNFILLNSVSLVPSVSGTLCINSLLPSGLCMFHSVQHWHPALSPWEFKSSPVSNTPDRFKGGIPMFVSVKAVLAELSVQSGVLSHGKCITAWYP